MTVARRFADSFCVTLAAHSPRCGGYWLRHGSIRHRQRVRWNFHGEHLVHDHPTANVRPRARVLRHRRARGGVFLMAVTGVLMIGLIRLMLRGRPRLRMTADGFEELTHSYRWADIEGEFGTRKPVTGQGRRSRHAAWRSTSARHHRARASSGCSLGRDQLGRMLRVQLRHLRRESRPLHEPTPEDGPVHTHARVISPRINGAQPRYRRYRW